VKKLLIIFAVLLGVVIIFGAMYSLFKTTSSIVPGEKVALVRIEGPIVDSKSFVDEIKTYADDSSVRAILLRVDSPGGAVAPSQEIYDEVKRATTRKKVVTSMGSVAASGGYYVAAPSNMIVANPGTITGSIGVIMEIPNLEGLMDKVGIRSTTIKSGKFKDIASSMREMTPEERRLLQNLMDDVHEQFIQAVAEGRGMTFEEVAAFADGRIFSGKQAKDIGLVDELGSLEFAIEITAELAGIEGEPKIVEREKRATLIDMLRGEISSKVPDLSRSVQIKYLLSP
jgi:protease-4